VFWRKKKTNDTEKPNLRVADFHMGLNVGYLENRDGWTRNTKEAFLLGKKLGELAAKEVNKEV